MSAVAVSAEYVLSVNSRFGDCQRVINAFETYFVELLYEYLVPAFEIA